MKLYEVACPRCRSRQNIQVKPGRGLVAFECTADGTWWEQYSDKEGGVHPYGYEPPKPKIEPDAPPVSPAVIDIAGVKLR